MKKFLNDILKRGSKYSRKSVIIALTFVFILGAGLYIIIDDTPTGYAVDVFNSLLIFEATLLGISIVDKKMPDKQTPTEE